MPPLAPELLSTRPHRESAVLLPGFDPLPSGPEPEGSLGDGRPRIILHPHPSRPRGPGLTMMSFNILLGGLYRQALISYFERLEDTRRMPDVIGLQEARLPIAELLASRFGFHLVYFGQEVGGGARTINGKAYLSRHPLRHADHVTYALSDRERRAAILRQGQAGDLLEDRGVLRVQVEVEGRAVLLYNVHHALTDSAINTQDLRQLNALLLHRDVPLAVVLGDFNADNSLRHLKDMDPLTGEPLAMRYGNPDSLRGGVSVGTIVDARLRHEFQVMEHWLAETPSHAVTVRARLLEDRVMTPRQAFAELRSDWGLPGSERWLRLRDIASSATLASFYDKAGAVLVPGKRFDDFYASPGLEPVLFEVDRSAHASDHPPVVAHYRLRGTPTDDGFRIRC
ncbi:MAG: endonuclease/exonuclease/phosphatase family protein [Myxococcaceae bacterium]|nr:MAG: endonuclease/exonuclease/phosphatase family protein [Myxococcaceae bacterium]